MLKSFSVRKTQRNTTDDLPPTVLAMARSAFSQIYREHPEWCVGPQPKKIIFRGNTTIVLWNDKTKTRSTCGKDDSFDPEIGFAVCLMKKLYHRKQLAKLIKRAQTQSEKK